MTPASPSRLVQIRHDDRGIRTVLLDDPARRNALSDPLLDALIDAIEHAQTDPLVRVIVLDTTDDRVFSAGGDLQAFSDRRPTHEKYKGLRRFPRLFELLLNSPVPTVCAARGDVLAGAFGLALACDMTVARSGVRFGCPEIVVGMFPFMISALIHRSVPRPIANELMLTGQLVDAAEAHRLHIINRVVDTDDFETTVDDLAEVLASRSPLLMRMGKQAIADASAMSVVETINYMRGQLALAFETHDAREGVTAFLEKRQPEWTGR